MKRALIFAAALTFCALSAKAQQTVIQSTHAEEDARNAHAAEQFARIDLQCGLVYGWISPLAMIHRQQEEWMAERGCYQDPPPLEVLIARFRIDPSLGFNPFAPPPKAPAPRQSQKPPPQPDPSGVVMNHRDTSHDFNHDGKAFAGQFFKSDALTESRKAPPPDPSVAMNHRDTSHDFNHDGKAFGP